MEPLFLQHAWLAGLALLAPAYLLSRRDGSRAPAEPRRPHASSQAQTMTWPGTSAHVQAPPVTSHRAAMRMHPAAASAAARPLRVVRVIDSNLACGGRLRISGRMADVCAELERLAEREALQAP